MSFVTPLALALAGLSVPLIALYFLKLRRRRVKVPSTLLWQAFVRSEQLATPFQRFRRNLLLLLQLLLLLLLVLAAARPYTRTDVALTRSVVLVVDASASMGATDVKPHRLGAAVAEAREIVDGMGPTDEAMVIVAGPTTEVAVPFTRDKGVLDAELGRIVATEAEGSLREGLQLAVSMARSRPAVEVVVLSDGGAGGLSDLPIGGATVHYVPVGRQRTNAAIVAIDLRRSPVSELERQLFVTVQNFGSTDVEGTVEVYVDDELVALRSETLVPQSEVVERDEDDSAPAFGGPVSMVFELPGSVAGVLRVHLDTPGDLLEADDTAYLVVSPVSLRKVLLVGGDALTARALRADPRVALTRAPALSADLADASDCVLFASGTLPDGLDGLSYAVLGPLPGSPVTFGEPVPAPAVLGWQRTHPVLRYVEWSDVIVARSTAVTDAGGLQSIVDGDGGPLVLAGERGGGRVVQLAFDPLHTDIPLRVAWPVTLLNTVGWLTEGIAGSAGTQTLATGAPYVRRVPDTLASATVTGPDGTAVDAQVLDALLRVRDTSAVGVYQIRGDGLKSSFTANLLSPRESDLAPRPALHLADSQIDVDQASVAGRRELWRPLALLALLVLMVEWFAWNRRKAA